MKAPTARERKNLPTDRPAQFGNEHARRGEVFFVKDDQRAAFIGRGSDVSSIKSAGQAPVGKTAVVRAEILEFPAEQAREKLLGFGREFFSRLLLIRALT